MWMSKLASPDCHTQCTNTTLKFKETYMKTMRSTEPMQYMEWEGIIYQMENLTLCNGVVKPCLISLPSWIEQVTLERVFLSQGNMLRGLLYLIGTHCSRIVHNTFFNVPTNSGFWSVELVPGEGVPSWMILLKAFWKGRNKDPPTPAP